MSNMTRRALLAALPVAAVTLLAAATLRKRSLAASLESDDDRGVAGLLADPNPQPVPDFGYVDADGHARRISDHKGQPMVVNFWATWCMPCVAELPSLDELAQQLKGGPIAVLTISSDRGGAETVRRFYATHHINALPVLLDPDMQAGHMLGLHGIPTTLLINADGQEVARLEGSADWGSAESIAHVRKLLTPPSAKPQTDAT